MLRGPARRWLSSARPELPDSARVVIVGGGIIGTSIAYHLAHSGVKDIVLLERDQLTSGTTWHAAGLMVTFGSLSETSTEIRKYSKALYSSLEEETGQSTGFMGCGFIELATSADRLEEYRRIAAFNRKCGVDVQEISPAEVESLFPLARVDDVLSGFYAESDGRVNPVDATMALAKGAKKQGATIVEGISVKRVLESRGKVSGVETDCGASIKADVVVNCAGMWARQLAEKSKVLVPNQAAEHYYLLTDAMPEVDPSWPVVEDPSSYAYIRPEGGGLMVGLFEGEGAAWNVSGVPKDFSFGEIEPDWERLAPYLEKAMNRVPSSLNVGAKKLFCGPESFTPDNGPVVGEAPELKNYFVCAGLNSIGILSGGGLGRLMAHWIKTGSPDMDVTGMNIDRFRSFHGTPSFRRDRVSESLGDVYKCHYPFKTKTTARGVKRSPLHQRLEGKGATFRDVSGWECADWFEADEDEKKAFAAQPLGWGKPPWFQRWAEEHNACRTKCALIDMSFMSKFKVQGPDAGRLLDFLSTSRVDEGVEPGTITYTQWLNAGGTMEGDLTVTKLPSTRRSANDDDDNDDEEAAFLVVATDTMHRHVETRMQRFITGLQDEVDMGAAFSSSSSSFARAVVSDVSGSLAQINLQGPLSRQVLQRATDTDLGNEAFPFRAAREIDIGYARVLCTRITYVGELGYELFVPTEQAVHVYDALEAAAEQAQNEGVGGGDSGGGHSEGPLLVPCGLKALSSLRMEKGYRDYGHDMDNCDTLLEVGLGFTAELDKQSLDEHGEVVEGLPGFVGMEAVKAQKALKVAGLKQRLVQVQIVGHPDAMMYHGEVVYRDGKVVGDVRAASYGHTLGGAVGLAMIRDNDGSGPLTKRYMETGTWEVDIAGKRFSVVASLQPLYDPKNAKIKA